MAAKFRDYYEILGVSKDADAPAIKKAFRKLARVYHPDVAKDKSIAEEKFKEINEAYEVLGDVEKRKKYDALGQSWDQPQGAPAGSGYQEWQGAANSGAAGQSFQFDGTGFSDFFEQYFSGSGARRAAGYGAGAQSTAGRSMRGQDIESDFMVTLEEAFAGAMRGISMRKVDPGTGASSMEDIQVRIPAGITEGQKLRIPGHGGAGYGGGEAGDLFLRVRLAAHPDFSVEGTDLYGELNLAPWEAALGVTVSIPVPSGKAVQLKVPLGSSSGDQLRLKGYGLPKPNAPGNILMEVRIKMPETITEKEHALWEKLAATSKFNPRKN